MQDLTAGSNMIVVAGLASLMKALPTSPVLVVAVNAVAWIMFLEDYMVLDSVLFIASHPLPAVFTRPIFLVALTYMAFKQWEIDLR